MLREAIESTNVKSVGHSRVLEVEYVAGATYQYLDVPQDIYLAFLRAESKGRFLNAVIKPNYECIEVQIIRTVKDSHEEGSVLRASAREAVREVPFTESVR